jgi:hypothetical protein
LIYITAAYEGHLEMLEAIFGKREDAPDTVTSKVTKDAKGQEINLTPSVFDAQFDNDNVGPRQRK